MKKKTIYKDSDNDMNELDRLVTQEINALQKKSRKPAHEKKIQKLEPRRLDNVIFQEGWQNNSNDKNIPRQQEPAFPDNLENFQDEKEDVLLPVENQQKEQASHTELFTEAELEFIEHSTAWLESRENKDLIISRIWEQLTESAPESFYSVQPGEKQEIEDSNTEVTHVDDNPGRDSPDLSN